MKYNIIAAIAYFLMLYFIAWLNARGSIGEKKYLGITETQWTALAVLWLPVIGLFLREG